MLMCSFEITWSSFEETGWLNSLSYILKIPVFFGQNNNKLARSQNKSAGFELSHNKKCC